VSGKDTKQSRKITVEHGTLSLTDDTVVGFFKKRVTKFGTGAKIDCSKDYLGKTVYVVVCSE